MRLAASAEERHVKGRIETRTTAGRPVNVARRDVDEAGRAAPGGQRVVTLHTPDERLAWYAADRPPVQQGDQGSGGPGLAMAAARRNRFARGEDRVDDVAAHPGCLSRRPQPAAATAAPSAAIVGPSGRRHTGAATRGKTATATRSPVRDHQACSASCEAAAGGAQTRNQAPAPRPGGVVDSGRQPADPSS
jgi:hypothetical protein